MSRPKRVRTVALFYGFPLREGGVETHLLDLVGNSPSSEFRWLVVGPTEEGFRRDAERLEAQVADWGGPRWRLDLPAFLHLVRLFKAQRVDLIHVHSPRWRLYALLAAWLLRLPVVSTIHLPSRFLIGQVGRLTRARQLLQRVVERLALRYLVDQTVFVSSRVHAEAVALKLVREQQSRIIPNGIDLTRFKGHLGVADLRRFFGVPPGAVVASFVGRLDWQKGLDILLAALRELPLGELNLLVWLVGNGPERAALEDSVCVQGMADRVTFLAKRDDIPAVLAASDFFVLPSRYEAMPISLVEAMAMGVPCVVADVGDCSVLVEDGVGGIVVPSGDVGALSAAITRMALNPELRRAMGTAARERSKRFDVTEMARATVDVYRMVLSCDQPVSTE